MTTWFRRATCVPTETRRHLAGLLGLLVLLLPLAAAAGADLELRLRADAFSAAEADNPHGRARLRLGWRGELAGARLRARLRADASDTPWGSAGQAELDELHLTWRVPDGLLRVGRQQIAWGRADAFRLLDTVNAQRYPDALFDDPSDARVPAWMVNWEAGSARFDWQLLAGHDRRQDSADPAWPILHGDDGPRPRHHGLAHLLGGRLGTRVGALDIGAYLLDGPDHSPPMVIDADGRSGRLSLRRRLWGMSADLPLGGVVWRSEAVLQRGQTVDAALQRVDQQQTRLLLGADLHRGDWLLSPQVYRERLSPVPYGERAHSRDFGSLLLRRSLLQDRASAQLFWLASFDGRDDWRALRIAMQASDRLEWRLQWDRFDSRPGGALAAFDQADRLSVEAVLRY
jgi:hypothetical protein